MGRALSLLAVALVLCGAFSQSLRPALAARPAAKKPQYPDCPFTKKPPTPTRFPTRCMDATEYSCCKQCQDLRNALGLVSANFSQVVQWAGILPEPLSIMNMWINGSDANMCTLFGYDDLPSAVCSNHIEQLACAMSCHPNSGDFMQQLDPYTYKLTICQPYYFQMVSDCMQLPIAGDKGGKLEQYAAYAPQFLNDLGNIAWGLSGFPQVQVAFTDNQTGPGCWDGMPQGAYIKSMCCDPLDTTSCPSNGVLQIGRHPYFKNFANDQNASVSCRVGEGWQGKQITAFSPPPNPPPQSPPSPPDRKPPPPPPSPPADGSNPSGSSGVGVLEGGTNLGATPPPPPPPKAASLQKKGALSLFLAACVVLQSVFIL